MGKKNKEPNRFLKVNVEVLQRKSQMQDAEIILQVMVWKEC